MISEKTKAAINEATSVTAKDESEIPKSDIQIVYGPLLKYGAVAFVLVTLIVTSAITIEQHLFEDSREIAGIDSHPDVKVSTKSMIVIPDVKLSENIVSDPTINNEPIHQATETTEITVAEVVEVEENIYKDETSNTEIVTSATESIPAVVAPVKAGMASDNGKPSSRTIILAQHNDIMLQNDQRQLEHVKLNHEKHIANLRKLYSQQNSYLEQNIQQIESNYLKQIEALKRSQDFRQSMFSRI